MNISFYKMTSEDNRIGKNKTAGITLSGSLKDNTSALNPEILIEADEHITEYNYMNIPAFGRFYFITGFESVRTGLWKIKGRVDVLESYKDEILQQAVVLELSENTGTTPYTNAPIWQTSVKDKTDIITFPNGLLNSGEFILITAGG